MIDVESHILGTLYGNCIGDAIGLLTEFLGKKDADYVSAINDLIEDRKKYNVKSCYKKYLTEGGLQYKQKVKDAHRSCWHIGDWTDDSDQMILILDMLLEKKKVDKVCYGEKLVDWARHGFKELGDLGGNGLGATTHHVLHHNTFLKDPHIAAQDIWEKSGCFVAPNGAVMRTSILGIYEYQNLEDVIQNTLDICKVTHADPRCQASCIAVTCAIAFMLQRTPRHFQNGSFNVATIIDDSLDKAKNALDSKKRDYKEKYYELSYYMKVEKLEDLKLDEQGKIGYTYKTLGAGFWALKQNDFKQALTDITMEAGDADTNGAVAGALLGCKLGLDCLPKNWLKDLLHKNWLDNRLEKFLTFAFPNMELKHLTMQKCDKLDKADGQHGSQDKNSDISSNTRGQSHQGGNTASATNNV